MMNKESGRVEGGDAQYPMSNFQRQIWSLISVFSDSFRSFFVDKLSLSVRP